MDTTDASVFQLNDENMTATAVKYAARLRELKTALLKASALPSLNNREAEEHLYGSKEAAKEWRLTFLNYTTLRDAMQMAESTCTLTDALGLESEGGVIGLQEEERDYVRGVLEDKEELAAELAKVQAEGQQREFDLLMKKVEKSELNYKTKCLLEEVKELRLSKEGGESSMTQELKTTEGKINQMRFMSQKVIMSCENAGQVFDEKKNEEIRDFFVECGKTPAELREDYIRGQNATPGSAADI